MKEVIGEIFKPPGCVAPNDMSICSIVGWTWGELKCTPLKWKKEKNSAFKSIVHHNLTWYIVKFDKKQKEIHNNALRIYLQQQHLSTSKQQQQLSMSKQTSKSNLTSISTWPCSYCKLQLSIDK